MNTLQVNFFLMKITSFSKEIVKFHYTNGDIFQNQLHKFQ